jgi:hypothetical protein
MVRGGSNEGGAALMACRASPMGGTPPRPARGEKEAVV